eukprot:CAMPEP_0201996712 /NCGR_PEP_ID=MMETSP0905-20130828/3856_1 /ASSEMBLY_ACC=CAM_ASM_000554 /TAXON_ID=420261 /ORGANISM="Thalassiosira antarctica, Strain CCMP982" /LENGTH=33 /DNA_ID= /DNA_START= /DNA_END= /DNA_ORIENTATION=
MLISCGVVLDDNDDRDWGGGRYEPNKEEMGAAA